MAGGGENSAQGSGVSDDPGFVTSVLSPLMRVVGLGIAARGGALGPALAAGGDFIAQARDDRLRRDVYANIMPALLQGVTRSREMPGVPGKPAVPGAPDVKLPFLAGVARPQVPMAPADEPAAPQADGANLTPPAQEYVTADGQPTSMAAPYEIPLTLPGRAATPATPDTPPDIRTWQTEPTLAEAMARLQGRGGPEVTRAIALRELLRVAGRLPTDPTALPAGVQDERDRGRVLEDEGRRRGYALTDDERRRGYTLEDEQRHIEQRIADEKRRAEIIQRGAPPGASPGYGASAATGVTPPAPPQETREVYTPDGRRQLIDVRTGRPLQDVPVRSPEQEQARAQALTGLIPEYERMFEGGVRTGLYNAEEAAVGRAMLANARRTLGDKEIQAFLDFTKFVANERGKERQAQIRARRYGAGGQPQETVTTREETIPVKPIWRKDDLKSVTDRLPDVVQEAIPSFKPPSGPIKTPSGKTVSPQEYLAVAKKAIEQRFLEQHGVEVSVQWVPSRWSANPLSGFSAGGEWKIVRAREPERKKSSVTERKKGPPAVVPVPAD